MSNLGKKITDSYCNGFAGRRYDLEGAIIEAEGKDWVIIRSTNDEPIFMDLRGWEKQKNIDKWVI
jgi:hypothetical protein